MFGLAIAVGIGLLLPFTILSNEVLLIYPGDQYPNLRWLNDKLITQLWHYIFISSNLCFILIPFSYFFAESTGFSRSTDNFFSRILQAFLETTLTLTIISSCVLVGLSSLFPIFQPNFMQLITFWINFPFLYSCISFAGAILLLVCTPKGIINLVIFLDEYMTRPYLVNSTTEKHDRILIEETVLMSRRQLLIRYKNKFGENAEKVFSVDKIPVIRDKSINGNDIDHVISQNTNSLFFQCFFLNIEVKSLSTETFTELIEQHEQKRLKLYQMLSVSWIRSKIPWLMYPLAMALLILTTAFSCAIVLINLLITLFNFEHTRAQPFVLGIASISKMGLVGACIQSLLIIYIWCASLVGLYSLPILGRLHPIPGKTPFFKIMLNCMVILILSSALPLFTRTVGITNFDLYGNFGQIVWLQNYHLVLVYNCAFLVALIICLCHNIVVKLSKEFLERLRSLFLYLNNCFKSFNNEIHKLKANYSTENSQIVSSKSISMIFRNTLQSLLAYLYSYLNPRGVHSMATLKATKKME